MALAVETAATKTRSRPSPTPRAGPWLQPGRHRHARGSDVVLAIPDRHVKPPPPQWPARLDQWHNTPLPAAELVREWRENGGQWGLEGASRGAAVSAGRGGRVGSGAGWSDEAAGLLAG